MDEAETVAKTPVVKPKTLEEVQNFLEAAKTFNEQCQENKTKLDAASESRAQMEKQTKADNEVETLNARWTSTKKISEDRVTKAQLLCDTWSELQTATEGLTATITSIPDQTTPDVAALETIFKQFREINERKVKLLSDL